MISVWDLFILWFWITITNIAYSATTSDILAERILNFCAHKFMRYFTEVNVTNDWKERTQNPEAVGNMCSTKLW